MFRVVPDVMSTRFSAWRDPLCDAKRRIRSAMVCVWLSFCQILTIVTKVLATADNRSKMSAKEHEHALLVSLRLQSYLLLQMYNVTMTLLGNFQAWTK